MDKRFDEITCRLSQYNARDKQGINIQREIGGKLDFEDNNKTVICGLEYVNYGLAA